VWKYNEAADELVKIVSSRATIPPDVFSRDLNKPSVNLGTTEGVDGLPLDPLPEVGAPSTGAHAGGRITTSRPQARLAHSVP
jgi:hypothetical protein